MFLKNKERSSLSDCHPRVHVDEIMCVGDLRKRPRIALPVFYQFWILSILMSHSLPRVLVPETQRCVIQIFGEERSSDDKFSHQGGLSLNEDFHAAVMTCSDTQTGGGGQMKNTSSTPQKTGRTGTQSRGTSTRTTASGVGGSEPPEDGRGKPLIPGHYRDHEEAEEEDDGFDSGDDDSDSKDESKNLGRDLGVACHECTRLPQNVKIFFTGDESDVFTVFGVYCSQKCAENARTGSQTIISFNLWLQNLGRDAGVACHGCTRLPQNVKIFFTGDESDVFTAFGVYCSQKCAENARTGSQTIISVNLWDTESSSIKKCLIVCVDFDCFMPLTVCRKCGAYMCERCSMQDLKVNNAERFRCRNNCPEAGMIFVHLPDCISRPAYVIVRQHPVAEVQRLRKFRDEPFDNSDDDDEVNEDNHGTPAGPPTEDYHPPVEESSVEQEIDDPVVEEDISEEDEEEEPLQLQEVPTIPPAPKEIVGEDEDKGCEMDTE